MSFSLRLCAWPARLVTLALCTTVLACTPTHVIKPLPNFIEAGVKAGDTIVVQTHDGKVLEFIVTDISDSQIFGEQQSVAIRNIASLRRKSWDKPKSPCGGEKPLGCSVPLLVRLASDEHEYFIKQFHDACTEHDYCYRHGARTYGADRDACDQRFLEQMLASCPAPPKGVFGKLLEVLSGNEVSSRRRCLNTADTFHELVRRFGSEHFLTDSSTYCEYDGPPD